MSEQIDVRTFYDVAPWRVDVEMVQDHDGDPRTDGDWADADDVAAWRSDQWEYVGLVAHVYLDGVEIGSDSIWSVVHGTLGNGLEVDAWEVVPAQYEEPNITIMPSTLVGVIVQAIDEAQTWLSKLATPAIDAMLDTFDPNRRKA